MDDLSSHFKVHAEALNIDPSLGVVNQGTIEVGPPPSMSETGEPHLPAAIGVGKAMPRKRQIFNRKPGGTLAEQLGTPEAVGEMQQTPALPQPSQPIDVPPRIAPGRNLSAEQMASVLTPKLMPQASEAIALEPSPYPGTHAKPAKAAEVTPELLALPPSEPVVPIPPVPTGIKADLKDLILRYIQKAGVEAAAKYFGKPALHIHNWVNGKAEPPLAAAQMLLDKLPKAREQYLRVAEQVYIDFEQTGEGSFARDHTKEELPVDLCLAVKGDIPPYVHWVFVTAAAQYGIGHKMMCDTIIIRSRNMLADMFLKGKAQWAIWVDADVLPTTGSAPWWKAIVRDNAVSEKTMSYDFIKRFLSHNKPFVGGVYSTRRRDGPMVMQPDLHPRGQVDRTVSDKIRKNTATGLYEVDWLSIGFCCVHRIVFETVRQKHPELQPGERGGPFPFFTPKGNEGEDVAFSRLARDSGFKLYLDTELFAAHVGRYAYVPSQSQFNGILDFNNA